MEVQTAITLIVGVAAVVSIILTVYKSVHKPQEQLETNQALANKELDNKASILAQKEMENKANLLKLQVELAFNASEKKFADMGGQIEKAFLLAANHTNTVDMKVDKLIEGVGVLSLQVNTLTTIIEERNPKK